MNAPNRLRRILALDRDDRRWLARSFFALAQIDVMLRLAGFQRTLARIERHTSSTRRPQAGRAPIGPDRIRRYAHCLEIASRHHVVPAHCLHRSLALHRWLRLGGAESVLRIGVRKDGDTLKAHAWVELDGQVINDLPSAITPFTPLANRRMWAAASHSFTNGR